MKQFIFSNKEYLKDVGLLVIRVGIGLIFLKHGWGKITGGQEKWLWLGTQMGVIGITFAPTFWGLAAAVSEFCGALFLIPGLLTRVAAFFMGSVMVVAVIMHYTNADPFTTLSHPLSLLCVFIGLCIAGAGKYSLDYIFFK